MPKRPNKNFFDRLKKGRDVGYPQFKKKGLKDSDLNASIILKTAASSAVAASGENGSGAALAV